MLRTPIQVLNMCQPDTYLIIYLPYSEVTNKHRVFLILFEKIFPITCLIRTFSILRNLHVIRTQCLLHRDFRVIYNQISWLRGWPDEYRTHNPKDPGLNPVWTAIFWLIRRTCLFVCNRGNTILWQARANKRKLGQSPLKEYVMWQLHMKIK